MKTLSLAILLAASLGFASTPAWADSQATFKFSYRAAELDTEQNRAALLQRMKVKVRSECRSGPLAYWAEAACRTDIERQLIAAIGNPALLAQYTNSAPRIARSGS